METRTQAPAGMNILARGPSLVTVGAADLLPGAPVLAINGAIFHHATPADYWLGIDDPGQFVPGHIARPWSDAKQPEAVTKAAQVTKWHLRWPQLTFHLYGSGPVGKAQERRPFAWETKVDWLHYSILTALHFAYARGVRHMRLLGVDMLGAGYSYSTARVEVKNGSEYRWRKERRMVAQALTELTGGGCSFDFGADRPLVPHLRPYTCSIPRCLQPKLELAYHFGPMDCACSGDLSPSHAAQTAG
jgi:hypothetical protein